MRLLAIPIVKNRIAFFCQSSLPSSSRLAQFVNWSNKKWDELGEAKDDTWKKKLHDKGNDMMNKLDYQEWFLKSVPTKEHLEKLPEKVIAYHPTGLTAADVECDLVTVLDKHVPYHYKYMKYSAYFVPLSCTFVIVPLIPNIPLAYNLFRLYSHYKAYKGGKYLNHLIQETSLQYQPCQLIDRHVDYDSLTRPDDVLFPEKMIQSYQATGTLDRHLLESDIPGVLDKKTIHVLSQQCQLPALELELLRARHQILMSIFLQKYQSQSS